MVKVKKNQKKIILFLFSPNNEQKYFPNSKLQGKNHGENCSFFIGNENKVISRLGFALETFWPLHITFFCLCKTQVLKLKKALPSSLNSMLIQNSLGYIQSNYLRILIEFLTKTYTLCLLQFRSYAKLCIPNTLNTNLIFRQSVKTSSNFFFQIV